MSRPSITRKLTYQERQALLRKLQTDLWIWARQGRPTSKASPEGDGFRPRRGHDPLLRYVAQAWPVSTPPTSHQPLYVVTFPPGVRLQRTATMSDAERFEREGRIWGLDDNGWGEDLRKPPTVPRHPLHIAISAAITARRARRQATP